MISMIDTIVNALCNDTEVNKLISSRVYWIRPTVKIYPYITLLEITNAENESADDQEYSDDIEIQIDIWSAGSIIPIAKEVQRVMRGLGFVHQAMPDEYEDDIKIFHKPIRFLTVKEV